MTLERFHMLFTLLILAGVIYSFVLERVPAYLTAAVAMTLLLLAGAIDSGQVLAVFSNPAPVTIACMFVISAALERTGVLDALGQIAVRRAGKRRKLTLVTMLLGVILVSAFMNNTPVVMIMAPVVITVARRLKVFPSRFLLPLCYAAILGGTCTLIGTSTNLLVDGIVQSMDQPAFSMFEITLPGIILAAVGATFLLLFGHKLLPQRVVVEPGSRESDEWRYTTEAVIADGSSLLGQTLNDVRFSAAGNYEIVDLVRQETPAASHSGLISRVKAALEDPSQAIPQLRSALRDIPLKAGDHVIFRASREELLQLKQQPGLTFLTEELPGQIPQSAHGPLRETTVVEGVVSPSSALIGRKTGDLRLRRRFGCHILAIHRGKQNPTSALDQIELRNGDVILIEGPTDELVKLFEHESILSLGQVRRRAFDRGKAPIAVFVLLGVVALAALGVMPIAGLAFAGAITVVAAGCITPDKAYAAIQWRILVLIFGMLGLSAAMESTGAARMVVEAAAYALKPLGPLAVLAMVYAIASLLTEFMGNNAVALLLTSLVIDLAATLGVDSRPFLAAVIFGASASFATPVGYQVNTFIYAVGNYRFSDFLRIGIPMKLLMFTATMLVIPIFWGFELI